MRKILILICAFFIFAQNTSAQVIINEVYPNPNSGESEWIELYNNASQSTDLSGWSLEDQLASPSIIYSFSEKIISGFEYLVITLASAKLNNSADGVTLKNDLGEVINSMSYEGSETGKSWALADNGWQIASSSAGLSNPEPSPTPKPTPTPSPSSSPSPTPSSTPNPDLTFDIANLQLSEISSCPISGEAEWIEIFNNSSNLITLEDWKVRDASDNTKTINLNINANSLAVIAWSGSLLNNSGDIIILESPDGQTAFEISFGQCSAKGNSFIYHDGSWRETSSATKGSENVYTNPNGESDEADQENVILNSFQDLDFDSTGILNPPTGGQYDIETNFIPPINLNGLVLGASTKENQSEENYLSDNSNNQDLADSRNALASAILGGLILATSSIYKLYEEIF